LARMEVLNKGLITGVPGGTLKVRLSHPLYNGQSEQQKANKLIPTQTRFIHTKAKASFWKWAEQNLVGAVVPSHDPHVDQAK
jgi:hypothetical protein